MKKVLIVLLFIVLNKAIYTQNINDKYNQQDFKYKSIAVLPIDGYADLYLAYLLNKADDRIYIYHLYESIIFGKPDDVIKQFCIKNNYDSLAKIYNPNFLFIEDKEKLKGLVDKYADERDNFRARYSRDNFPSRYNVDTNLISSIGALLKVDALFAVFVYDVKTGETALSSMSDGAPILKTKCWLAYAVVDTKTKRILHFGNEKNKETSIMKSSLFSFGGYTTYTGNYPSLSQTVMGALETVMDNYPEKKNTTYSQNLFNIFNEKNYGEYRNSPDKIKELVNNNKAQINTKDVDGNTVLHYAAYDNNEDAVKIFLDNGAIINAKNNMGCTALMYAADTGSTNIAKLLISRGAEINCIDVINRSALFFAADKGSMEMIKLLVDNGADINMKAYAKQTPLMIAADNGFDQVVNYLVSKGADITNKDYTGRDALFWASISLKSKAVESLIKAGVNVNTENCIKTTPLIAAIESKEPDINRDEVIKLLLDNGANPDATDLRGKAALILATTSGNEKMIEMLLSKGANVDIKDLVNNKTPLQIAIENKNDKIIGLLIAHKCNVNLKNADGLTPLMIACNSADITAFNLLIKNGANINDKDNNDESIFIKACKIKDEKTALDILNALISAKVDVNTKDNKGNTGLIYACLAGNQETVKYLLSKSANINITDNDGNDALLQTIKLAEYDRANSHQDIARQLINIKTDINYCNNNGITPFTGAVIKNWNIEVLDLLLSKGAKINIKDKKGLTAMDYCANAKTKKYLKSKGALKGNKVKNNEYATPIPLAAQTNTNAPVVSNIPVTNNSTINNTSNTTQNTVNPTNSQSSNIVSGNNTTVNTTPTTSVNTTSIASGTNTTNNKTTSGNTVTSTTSNKKFFIIAGSYETEQAAKDEVASLQKKGFPNAEVVGLGSSGRWRICYKAYYTKDEAMKDLPDIKQYTDQSAWIFEKKQ